MATGMAHIGTSGWSYDWWRGVFYPREIAKNRWLTFYASRFKTVEINYSFYRLPSKAVFEKWRDTVGPDFTFAVKASRYITHNRKLKDCREPWKRFYDAAYGLGDKLGPVLFEFPATGPKNTERLAGFLEVLPGTLRYAFEFRHPSWFDGEIYELLTEKGASLVTADSPHFPQSFEETADFSFIRFHGGRILYGSEYSLDELRVWASRIVDMTGRGRDVYAYFNNDAFGFAPKNAAELEGLLYGREEEVA